MRTFNRNSFLNEGNLALSLAPALTPKGIDNNPHFFSGTMSEPQIISRGLLVLSDIVTTRYFNYTPESERDPVLTASGDRLRAECFSACNGVYARFDMLQNGLEGSIGYGTTNVDIGTELRKSLINVKKEDKLNFLIGDDGLNVRHLEIFDKISTLNAPIIERPVKMPDRWVRALGNVAGIHKNTIKAFSVSGILAKQFIASLPPSTGKEQSGYLTYSKSGVKLLPRYSKDSVFISGLHRLSALKRVFTDIKSITFYAPISDIKIGTIVEVELSNAKITLSLTAQSWQGYSGEGALLISLAEQKLLDEADIILSNLTFESAISISNTAKQQGLSEDRVNEGLSLLAATGSVGFDIGEQNYFHRELPHDPDRVLKDNPRLLSAQKLLEDKCVEYISDDRWIIHSKEFDYRVIFPKESDGKDAKCTCKWYLSHQNNRGPCKHILSVKLWREQNEQ